MANLFDYIKWRGDISLLKMPFNDVDSLIICRLAYLPFEGIVGEQFCSGAVTIKEAADLFFLRPGSKVAMKEDLKLLSSIAESPRFQNMRLSGFMNQVSKEEQEQFSAIVIELGDTTAYVAYRGTDDTLVGWRENFNMSFMAPVPAQKDAVFFLKSAANCAAGNLRVGGHSKGGNLAVYASAFCGYDIQQRILKVYNNDGPGFDKSTLSKPGYDAICTRIHTFVPQSSVIGMLLEHEEQYTIIHSNQSGLMQHDLYSWEVLRDGFVTLDQVTNASRYIDQTLKDWLTSMDQTRREQFITALFDVLEATNASTLDDLSSHWYDSAKAILKTLKHMDDGMRDMVGQTLLLLLGAAGKNLPVMRK